MGETGCGKSTLARVVTRLYEPTEGTIEFEGRDITRLKGQELRRIRRDMQMIFQDPYASLNPRKTVGSIIGAPYRLHKTVPTDKVKGEVQQLMELVGLNPEHYNRYPHEFSGGQRQRIGVARSLALRPKLIVADEPVSALDVSVQAQILNLLADLQSEFNLTYLFIAHDLVGREARLATVSRSCTSARSSRWPTATRCIARPSTRTPAHCCRPCRSPIPSSRSRRSASSSRATCPRRSTRRRAAASTRGARRPSRSRKSEGIPDGVQPRCRTDEPLLESFGGQHVAACHFPLEETIIPASGA